MSVARGNARWISPAHKILSGILSVTRELCGASVRRRFEYSSPSLARYEDSAPTDPASSERAPRSVQKGPPAGREIPGRDESEHCTAQREWPLAAREWRRPDAQR